MPEISKKMQAELKRKNCAQQFARDKNVWKAYYDQDAVLSSSAQDISKRLIMAVHEGGLMIRRKNSQEFQSAAELNQKVSNAVEKLSVLNVISHGGRVLIEIPPLSEGQKGNEFFNWVMTGNAQHADTKTILANQPALDQRGFASHETRLVDGHQQEVLLSPLNLQAYG